MDTRELSTHLHDILRTACRVRQPGPGMPADAGLVGLDEVKGKLRNLIRTLGDEGGPQPPARVQITAGAFPEGPIPGTRATVEHRRRGRTRSAIDPAPRAPRPLPSPAGSSRSESSPPRRAAEAEFASLTRGTAAL